MIPLRDSIPSRTTPYVSYGIIAACVLVHALQWLSSTHLLEWALVPRYLISPGAWFDVGPVHVFGSLIASQFLHGDLLHLGSNMLFLWVFGDNVEDRLGHGKFIIFYLACGVIASLVQSVFSLFPEIPMLGASGAIAGVLGAYFVLYRRAWIRSLVIIFVFPIFVEIPALIFIGIWFILQIVNAIYSIGGFVDQTTGAGVAFAAHAAGFLAGIYLLRLFIPKRSQPRYRVVRMHVD